jgi:hypothetical protein
MLIWKENENIFVLIFYYYISINRLKINKIDSTCVCVDTFLCFTQMSRFTWRLELK